MPIPLKDFWKSAIDSRLLSVDECQSLHAAFTRVRGAQQGNSATLAEWLVASSVLSRYQASVLLAGKTRPFLFDEYKVYDKHESGRFKGLYRAVHLPTGYSVSLYFLSLALSDDPRQLAAVIRQAKGMAVVRDEHLGRVFEFVERKAAKFVVVEDLAAATQAGVTLADYLAAQPLAPADSCRVVRDVALGLAALHEAGLAHGDVRPQNIWLTADGGVKLLGFPLARDPAEPAGYQIHQTQPSARLVAQADYLAPELAHGRRAPDAKADVYSLGCLAYSLLISQPPFAGGDVAQKLARHASEPAVPLEQFGMPPALAQLIAHMMAKNPPVRLDSAAAVAERLVAFATADPTAGRPISPMLAAYERIVAQRQDAGAGSDAEPGMIAGAGNDVGTNGASHHAHQFPAMSGDAPAAIAPGSALPQMESVGHAGTLAVADLPAARAGLAPASDDLSMLGPPGVRVRRERPPLKINPMLIAGAVLVVFAVGGIIAGLATQSSAPADKPEAPSGDNLASTATTPGEEKQEPKPKKKQPKHPEIDSADTPPEDKVDDDNDFDGPDVANTRPGKTPRSRPAKPAFQAIDDDGSSLWISPTAGAPISLRYLPAGGQLFLIARPSEILGSAEGARMVDGLGPAGQFAKDQIKAITGVDPAKIEQLIVGYYPNEMGPTALAFVVRLSQAAEEEELVSGWQNPAAAEHDGKKYFKNGASAYYIPEAEQGKVFAIMPATEVEETLNSGGPSLGKDMDKLLAESDEQRQFTVMAAPFALFRAGKSIFVGELERLEEPLEHFIGPGIPAALLSIHVAGDLFVEARVVGDSTDEPFQLASRYRSQLEKVPDQFDDYLASFNQQNYGKRILMKFPKMIRALVDFTRIGEDHRQAVLRAYLPANAGHNLVMGTELALYERPGAAGTVASKGPAAPKATGAAESLKQKISLSFPRDTLEKCMEMLGKEIDTEVVILGGDLQLDGITKNQSFGLNERDKPAEEILRIVLKLANPDGKLVYVIKPKDGGKDAIFITTRAQVEKRGDKLPPELVQNPAKGK